MEIRKICVLIVTTMMLAAFTPLVFAAAEDNVVITFDPNGDIDIDISLASYNFTGINAGTTTATTGGTFSIWNNGTVSMDTQVKTNDTTDNGDMQLNVSAISPVQDEFAFFIDNAPYSNWVNNSYTFEMDQSLIPNDYELFDLQLKIGTNLSANHSWQMITIYFQGTQS